MIATLLGLAGYLLYMALMVGLAKLVFRAVDLIHGEAGVAFVLWVAVALPFALKDMLWLALISGFSFTFPSGVSEMIAILVGLAGYLVYMTCMMGLSMLVMCVVIPVCLVPLGPEPKEYPDWLLIVIYGGHLLRGDGYADDAF